MELCLSAGYPQIKLKVGFFLDLVKQGKARSYKDIFVKTATKLWDCYGALTKRSFSQKNRRLVEWDQKASLPSVILNPIEKLKANLALYASAYDFPGAHRTSNMTDRLMQRMDRHLFSTQYFHGTLSSAELNIRGWALINNFAPSNPSTFYDSIMFLVFTGIGVESSMWLARHLLVSQAAVSQAVNRGQSNNRGKCLYADRRQ